MFIFRRICISAAVVLFSDIIQIQMTIFYVLSYLTIAIILEIAPLHSPHDHSMELFNEGLHLLLVTLIPIFSADFIVNDQPGEKVEEEWYATRLILGIMLSHIIVNLLIILGGFIKTNYTRYRIWNKRRKFLAKLAKKREARALKRARCTHAPEIITAEPVFQERVTQMQDQLNNVEQLFPHQREVALSTLVQGERKENSVLNQGVLILTTQAKKDRREICQLMTKVEQDRFDREELARQVEQERREKEEERKERGGVDYEGRVAVQAA